MKSTFGYVFNLGSSAMNWTSKKGEIVAQSTAEAEYISLSVTTNQAPYYRNCLQIWVTNSIITNLP